MNFVCKENVLIGVPISDVKQGMFASWEVVFQMIIADIKRIAHKVLSAKEENVLTNVQV